VTVFQGSRYEDETIVNLVDTNGVLQATIVDDVSRLPAQFTYTIYVTVANDRIDLLANSFYGNSEQWWVIADANPNILFWDQLPAGLILRIPSAVPS
jgi:phage tail protein X